MVRLSSCKFFADGAMSERTAFLSQEYADQPGWKGCMVLDEASFCKRVERAYSLGVKAKLFCPEIAGLFCRIAGLFCHDSRANLSLKPVCFGIAIS